MEPLSKHPLEAVSFGLFSYVEGLPGFRSLAVEPRSTSPATAAALKAWHAEYGPLQLPDDLAAFFEICDGVSIRWKCASPSNAASEIVVGSLSIASVANLKRSDDSPPAVMSEDIGAIHYVAFLLERQPKVGDVALVFTVDSSGQPCSNGCSNTRSDSSNSDGTERRRDTGSASPEVWFRDRAGAWHWLCSSFTAYWRLACVHLGVLGWQNAFSPQGLPPLTVQWMRLYCPERLALDVAKGQKSN